MSNKYYIVYLLTFFIGLVTLAGCYVLVFEAQFGKPVKTEWWVKRSLDYKAFRAQQLTDKKIIIAGGSNGLFGIESPIVENFTGYSVVNMSAHASLDLEFITHYLEPHVKAGDVVVLPLEFKRYKRSHQLSDWFARNMIAWGSDTYLQSLNTIDYLAFIARTPKMVIWDAFQASNADSKLMSQEQAVEEVVRSNQRAGGLRFQGYSHLSLNLYGDILAEFPPHQKVRSIANQTGDDYKTLKSDLSPIFLDEYRQLEKMVEEKGGQLVLTWPVTIRNKLFDMANPEHQENMAYLTQQLSSEGIDIHCEPGLFNLDYRLFSNSMYHLNAKGARVRSIVLGDCLRSFLSGKEVVDQPDDLIVSKLKELEANFIRMKYPLPK